MRFTMLQPNAVSMSSSLLKSARDGSRIIVTGSHSTLMATSSSIFDKNSIANCFDAPMRLAIKSDTPAQWPAWNMDWADQTEASASLCWRHGSRSRC